MAFRYAPTSPTFAAESHAVYKTMRDEFPVWEDPKGRFFALSRYADVLEATRDWQLYSTAGRLDSRYSKPTMNSFDPPRHTKLRAIVSRAFTPRRISDLEPAIRAIARGLIGDFLSKGSADFVSQYASLVPSMVIGRLIGLPEELVPVCRELTDEHMRHTDASQSVGPTQKAYAIFAELYEARRREPKDDLMTALLQAEIDGERLSEDDLLAFGWLLLVGGNDTTTNLIGNGLELFARHPDVRRELIEDPTLLAGAVDEVLRHASPTYSLPRRTTRAVELHGKLIPADAQVHLLWSSANLDEREFEDPERFDIHRGATRHLALGHGIHYCLGASLAKLEAEIAWGELLRRIPDYTLVEPPRHFVSSTFHGFEALRVAWPVEESGVPGSAVSAGR
jgi:cytochrome P450